MESWLKSVSSATLADLSVVMGSVVYTICNNLSQSQQVYLCDVGQSNKVRHKADNCNEDLSAVSKSARKFIDQRGDEAFHGAELERWRGHVETVT